jgi:8-oxo-dGTP diphosphatase
MGEAADQTSSANGVVVAAAITRSNRVLLARRTRPADTAGLWEFPGGRVEQGESDAAALGREIREELGVRIEVGELIGAHGLPGIGELRLYAAGIIDGREPRLLDHHDQLRWVSRRRLAELPLAPGDATLAPRVVDLE